MITTLTPLLLDGTLGNAADHVTTVAAPIWDIGSNIKNQGITFAVYALMGGTALVAAFQYFVKSDKTQAMKAVVVGIALTGIIGALPALGVVSRDTVNGITNSGGYR
jgi:hypothetical protein